MMRVMMMVVVVMMMMMMMVDTGARLVAQAYLVGIEALWVSPIVSGAQRR